MSKGMATCVSLLDLFVEVSNHVHTLFFILKFSQSLRDGKMRSKKFYSNFKIGYDTTSSY